MGNELNSTPLLYAGLIGALCLFLFYWMANRRQDAGREPGDDDSADMAVTEIYLFDAESLKLIEANHNAGTQLGYSPEELRDLTLCDLHPTGFRKKLTEFVSSAKGGGKRCDRYKSLNVRRDGSSYPVEVDIQYTRCNDTSVIVVAAKDITALIKAEELQQQKKIIETFEAELEKRASERTAELEAANRSLELVNQAKSEFVNIVSHELRTPLTSIRSFAEILRKDLDELDRESKLNFLGIIDEEAGRLTRLINDLLDLQRLDSGRMVWRDSEQNLYQLVNETVAFFSAAFKNKGISLVNQLPPDDNPYPILIDSDKMKQILSNLLSNALKFTEQGEVTVRLDRVHKEIPTVFACTQIDKCPVLVNPEDVERSEGPSHPACCNDHRAGSNSALVFTEARPGEAKVVPLPHAYENLGLPILKCNEQTDKPPLLTLQGISSLYIVTDDREQTTLLNSLHARLSYQAECKDNYQYRIRVEDTGRGIPESDIERIFERFHQVNDISLGGSGLGLAICREYIEHYQGSIEVESELGEGSVFTILLPPTQPPRQRLGEILIESGLLTEEQINEALKIQSRKGIQ